MSAAHPLAIALERGLRSIDLDLPAAAQARLLRYLDEMARWNTAYNLTAIRAPGEMVIRHLLDSLVLLPVLRALPAFAQRRLLDVGAGAGLPGIPLAIAVPELAVTVLDSNGKKARFMRHAQRTLALANVEVAETRVESFAPAAPYPLIVSRAFASLADFFTATGPLLAEGGVWVAMKGKLDAAELAAVPAAVDIRETHRLRVPGLDEERHAVVAYLKP
ncbi:MAG TPA: 16S rRNA (guanine(527)-N(7))-methyltransferase RsmG [Solimonas sp.]|nr:16S rRNA (guanine(527)-N(7))-methyltransferase RsmG [Solimonas sp.]